ncbi:MAG: AAA family ATPase [Methylococcales bacterium]
MHNNQKILIQLGEHGVGKTTTLIETMNRLDSQVKFFYISAKYSNFKDLVRGFCDRAGISSTTKEEWPTQQLLDNDLRQNEQLENPYTLIFDDAHKFDDDILKKILLLSISPSKEKSAFQIILSGLPELRTRISQLKLYPIDEHDIDYRKLENMEASDTGDYIRRRLASNPTDETSSYPSTTDAISRIYHYSKGNPGQINKFCKLARTIADSEKETLVTTETVEKVADILFFHPNQKSTKYQRWSIKKLIEQRRIGRFSKTKRYFALAITILIPLSSYFLLSEENSSSSKSVPKPLVVTTNSNQERLPKKNIISVISTPSPKESSPNITPNRVVPSADTARQYIQNLEAGNSPIDLESVYNEAEKRNAQKQLEDAYLLYFYAARQGNGSAAFKLAQLYDPTFFKLGGSIIDTPNLIQARKWYQHAADAGHPDANRLLEQLRSRTFDQAARGDENAQRLTLRYQ